MYAYHRHDAQQTRRQGAIQATDALFAQDLALLYTRTHMRILYSILILYIKYALYTVSKQCIMPVYCLCAPDRPCVTIRVLIVSTGIITQHAPAAANEPKSRFSSAVPALPTQVLKAALNCWKNIQVNA